MRSRLSLLGAALVSVVAVSSVATHGAFAAGAKGKASAKKAAAVRAAAEAAKKKTAELLVDERAINKQMQWEDKVMGSNSAKKAELAKIARAQAITKAAEQAAAEKNAAAPIAAPKPTKSAVNLPALADEGDRNGKKDDSGTKNRELSANQATPEASASVPAPRPGDDKFIDKILASDGNKKKSAKSNSDGELEQLLAKDNDKSGRRKAKRKDSVDDLLENVGKATEPPVAVKASRNADIERMEPLPTPPPMAPVAIKKLASFKRDDGIIHVVQGANYSVPTATRNPVVATVTAKPETPPTKPANWKDPFADNPSTTRKVDVLHEEQKPPASPEAPPSHAPGWKDPFSENTQEQPASASDAHGRELSTTAPAAVAADPPESKWKMAARHRVSRSRTAVDGRSRWSVLKKR